MSIYVGRQLFFKARLAAIREDLIALLTGRPADLLPFDAVTQALGGYDRRRLPAAQSIPLERVVGSTGRHRDFTRRFRPRGPVNAERWARLDAAMADLEGLPPIEVFQVGGVYFVANGNHRVSVARASGFTEVDAYVTLIMTDASLEPGDSLDEAVLKAERAGFYAKTRLLEQAGEPDIDFARPGGYPRLLEDISAYRHLLAGQQAAGDPPEDGAPPVSLPEAAAGWYSAVYLPAIRAIRRENLPVRFPRQTVSELYLLVASGAAGRSASVDDVREILGRKRPSLLAAILSRFAGWVQRVVGLRGGPRAGQPLEGDVAGRRSRAQEDETQ